MVVPEFFFLKPGTDSLVSTIDIAVVNLVKKYNKKLIASVKNYTDQGWDGNAVRYMIGTAARGTNFISQLVKQLQAHKLDDVNIDFEDLVENSDEFLNAFQKQLYQILHSKGFIVTQDVSPVLKAGYIVKNCSTSIAYTEAPETLNMFLGLMDKKDAKKAAMI